MRLSSQLQIASDEGGCNPLGYGIGSLVTTGRHILSIFGCAVGQNEHRPYKVIYTLNKSAVIPPLSVKPSIHSRSVNELYASLSYLTQCQTPASRHCSMSDGLGSWECFYLLYARAGRGMNTMNLIAMLRTISSTMLLFLP
jgi:hypothetical protein